MQSRLTSQMLSLGMAVAVTLAMLAGVNQLSSPRDEATDVAQGADEAPAQQVIVTGHRVRS